MAAYDADRFMARTILCRRSLVKTNDDTMKQRRRRFLPGARIVRAFNCVGYTKMQSEAHRAGERLAIPLAADDAPALQVAIRLVQDAGFEPVAVGGLARAKDFDAGTPIFGKALTAAEVRRELGIKS
jgi:predicted dinucleotide-binding enzyme